MKATPFILAALSGAVIPAAAVAQPAGTQPADKPSESALGRSDDWQKVRAFWREAQPLATTHKSTTAQREKFMREKLLVGELLGRLEAAKLVSPEDKMLLANEWERLRTEVFREPPTDAMVRCYDMAFMPPARASLARLVVQAGLLEKQVQAAKLSSEVMDVLRPTITSDLAVLASEKELAQLSNEERAKATETAHRIRRAIEADGGSTPKGQK